MLPKRDIYKNQTEIMRWLESRGHQIIYGRIPRSEMNRLRGCTKKRRFDSIEDAKKVAGGGMTFYECKHCLGYHAATPK